MKAEQKIDSLIFCCKELDERDTERMMKWLAKEIEKLTDYEVQLLEKKLLEMGIAIGG